MRALILRRYGDPDVLQVGETPDPVPGSGEVLVDLRVSGVNPIDLGVRAGNVLPDSPDRFPMVLGWDGAGIVEALGPEVANLAIGDRVMVMSKQPSSGVGLHADMAAVTSDFVIRLPDRVSFEHAAAAPLASITALNAVEALDLVPGQTVHVNNPVGAVGRAARQIARHLGLRVSDAPAPGTADGAIDVRGGIAAQDAFDAVADGGRYATVIPEWWKPGGPYTAARGIEPIVIENAPTHSRLEQVVAYLADGVLRPEIETTFPLEEGAKAHAMLEAPGPTGKLLLIH
ncbi:MAG: NADP-dependent oxidoreductase [Pseudomonadota bacterium]